MKFGPVLVPESSNSNNRTLWEQTDKFGFDVIGIADSPGIAREVFISCSVALTNTSDATIMPAVTNPVARDVSVVASALLTLHELAPGRVALGIGTGDSALWGVGLRPAKVSELEIFIRSLKNLLSGNSADYNGRDFRLRWKDSQSEMPIPIFVACSGPKVLRLAAQYADGIILAMGFSPENLSFIHQTIAEACYDVGRNPRDLVLWGHSTPVFAATISEAMESNLGVNPGWLTMGSLEGKQIPEEFRRPLIALTSDFQNLQTEYSTKGRGAALVAYAKELGVYEWLISRAPGLWGPPEVIAQRLLDLTEHNIDNWLFYLSGDNDTKSNWLSVFATDVLPIIKASP